MQRGLQSHTMSAWSSMFTKVLGGLWRLRVPCVRHYVAVRTRQGSDCVVSGQRIHEYVLVLPNLHSHMLDKLEKIICRVKVRRPLLRCEHTAEMSCCQDGSSIRCKELCGEALTCCSKTCKSACSDCQAATVGPALSATKTRIARTAHISHPCDRLLYCQHQCGLPCSQDHHCNLRCDKPCRQQCIHYKCPKPCSEPCAPCMEPCPWMCAHHACPVVCGSVSRLSHTFIIHVTDIS